MNNLKKPMAVKIFEKNVFRKSLLLIINASGKKHGLQSVPRKRAGHGAGERACAS